MINLKRARVAIGVLPATYVHQPGQAASHQPSNVLHIGHVRTIILGELVAKELGIEFHIRFDGRDLLKIDGKLVPWDRGNGILDVVSALSFLDVRCDNIYWSPNDERVPYLAVAQKMGQDVSDHLRDALSSSLYGPDHHLISTMLDDAMDYAPSLILRGMEFGPNGIEYFAPMAVGPKEYIAMENLVYQTLGVEKHEMLLPLILVGSRKMSKSEASNIHWSSLTPIGTDLCRKFMVATAICPDDPFSALEESFSIDKIDPMPYRWSWDHWKKLAKMSD